MTTRAIAACSVQVGDTYTWCSHSGIIAAVDLYTYGGAAGVCVTTRAGIRNHYGAETLLMVSA